jgi:hypothetical protein
MQPEAGGRFEALLIHQDEAGARFRVELSTAGGVWSSEALVAKASGEVEWGAWSGPGEAPEWLCRSLRAALRSAWRAHEEDGWPRRFTRWRDVPDVRRTRDEEG